MERTFKVRLRFNSLISISSLIGFCAGVVWIPVQMITLFTSDDTHFITALLLVVLSPMFGLINGFLLGLVAYPCYAYICRRVGFSYTGVFLEKDSAS